MSVESNELVEVKTAEDWNAYHQIRRVELFENRGRSDYDPQHLGERAQNKFQLLYKLGGKPIGTARLDLFENRRAAIRMVAITQHEQKKGYGRDLMNEVESYAKAKGASLLMLNATPSAVGFYTKLGFKEDIWDDPDLPRAGIERVQMIKRI